jgi:hypothetical protein
MCCQIVWWTFIDVSGKHCLLVKSIYAAGNVGEFLPEEMSSHPKKTVICIGKGINVYIYRV